MATLIKLVKVGALLLLVAVATTGILFLHRVNAGLRAQVGELRRRNDAMTRIADENRRTREVLTRMETDAKEAAQKLSQEVGQMRAEVNELEEDAHHVAAEKYADKVAAAATLAANRDPEKALVRLEYFQNVGRSTPAAAVQTLVWGALKGDETTLKSGVSVTGDAREKALDLIAHLSDADRAKYPTPESLAALVFESQILMPSALQVVATAPTDAQHATVSLRCLEVPGEEALPMELGAEGWKVVVDGKMVDRLKEQLGQASVARR